MPCAERKDHGQDAQRSKLTYVQKILTHWRRGYPPFVSAIEAGSRSAFERVVRNRRNPGYFGGSAIDNGETMVPEPSGQRVNGN